VDSVEANSKSNAGDQPVVHRSAWIVISPAVRTIEQQKPSVPWRCEKRGTIRKGKEGGWEQSDDRENLCTVMLDSANKDWREQGVPLV
jgi:hypothetical protein